MICLISSERRCVSGSGRLRLGLVLPCWAGAQMASHLIQLEVQSCTAAGSLATVQPGLMSSLPPGRSVTTAMALETTQSRTKPAAPDTR